MGMHKSTLDSTIADGGITPAKLSTDATPIKGNWSFNSDFEVWGAGVSAAPTGWTLAGASATVAKNTTANQFKRGTASVAVTRAGADATLYQDIDLISGFGPAAAWGSKTVVLGMWVRATVASRARIFIDDGTTTTYSSYHTGGSSLEFLTVTVALQATPTRVRVGGSVDTGNTTAQFDAGVFSIGSKISDWIPSLFIGRKSVIVISSGGTDMASANDFYGNCFGQAAPNEAYIQARVPYKGVMRNAQYICAVAPGGGNTFTSIVRKNAASTSLTASITGTNVVGEDNTNEVEFAKGDKYSAILTVKSGGNVRHTISVEYEEVP